MNASQSEPPDQSVVRELNEFAATHPECRRSSYAHHMPVTVHLQVASGCNLDCYMCIEHLRPPEARFGRGMSFLSRDVFDKLCEQVFPYSKRLHIGFGGEPTLAPDFAYFIERAHDCGQEIHLTTNGTTLLKPRLARVLAERVKHIRISIDAATAQTYERIRVGSRWPHLISGLESLNAERLKQSPDERTQLVLVFVLMKSNLHELPAFVELAKTHHADGVRCQHVLPTTEKGKGETLFHDPGRYNEILAQAAARAEELDIELDAPAPYPMASIPSEPASPAQEDPTPPSSIDCRLPTEHLFLSYLGVVTPCCNPYANARMHVGDLREQDFEEIWNNESYRSLRRSLTEGPFHPICEGCSISQGPSAGEPRDPEWLLGLPTLHEWGSNQLGEDSSKPPSMLEAMESSGIVNYFAEVLQERDALREHAATLEQIQPQQVQHIANLEQERPHLLGHIENLEAILHDRTAPKKRKWWGGKR